MQRLRILQTTPFFYPAKLATGPASVARAQSRGLVLRGHEVSVYTSNTCDGTSALDVDSVSYVDGVTVHYCPSLSHRLAAERIVVCPKLLPLAKRQMASFDIVHLHDYRTFDNLMVSIFAERAGVPYILQAHGTIPRMIGKRGLKGIFDACFGHWMLRNASKLIALYPMEAEQYSNAGVGKESIEVLPNGIEKPRAGWSNHGAQFRKRYEIAPKDPVVLFLGRLHRIKGLDLLLESVNLVRDRLADVKLVLAGPDDGYLHVLERTIHALGLEKHVLMTGNLADQVKWSALEASDVLVLPSHYEAFPVAVLEAWSVGLPVVVTPRNGLADWVRTGGGIVVPRDQEMLADALFMLLTESEQRRELGEQGKQLVEQHFTWEKVLDGLEQIYYGVIERAGRG